MKQLLTFVALLVLLLGTEAQATHLKAANITYQRIQGLSFQVTVTLFSGSGFPVVAGSNGVLNFGDGTSSPLNPETARVTDLGNSLRKFEYTLEHTFPQADSYLISYSEPTRNEGILNVENSVNMNFYLESFLKGYVTTANNSPLIQHPPLGIAYLGETYFYNPGATDPDGDSLSYHLVPTRQARGEVAAGYTFPHKTFAQENGSETGEGAYLLINPTTGDLVWDAPVTAGEYNVVVQIREWRNIEGEFVQIGFIEQDMQIVVGEARSAGIQLEFPVESQQLQLETGMPFEFNIRALADNPDDTVILMLTGDFLQENPMATPSDSIGGKGTQEINIRYTPTQSADKRYQLIATATLYNKAGESESRSRAVHLLAPGFVNGIRETAAITVKPYPNPSSINSFYLDSDMFGSGELSLSLFNSNGKLVHQETRHSLSTSHEIIIPGVKLQGNYLLLIRQKHRLYKSKIIFSQ